MLSTSSEKLANLLSKIFLLPLFQKRGEKPAPTEFLDKQPSHLASTCETRFAQTFSAVLRHQQDSLAGFFGKLRFYGAESKILFIWFAWGEPVKRIPFRAINQNIPSVIRVSFLVPLGTDEDCLKLSIARQAPQAEERIREELSRGFEGASFEHFLKSVGMKYFPQKVVRKIYV